MSSGLCTNKNREGKGIHAWKGLKDTLLKRFQPPNRTKTSRGKLTIWKQIQNVSSFNEVFLRIFLVIPSMSEEKKIDRYSRA